MFDVSQIRKDFPILAREVNGKPLVYLDNGASSQKPEVVINAVARAYKEEYANVHRGLHYLSNVATEKYESVRGVVAKFLNASDENEIILNSGTTEGINMLGYGASAQRRQHRFKCNGTSCQYCPMAFFARKNGYRIKVGRHRW